MDFRIKTDMYIGQGDLYSLPGNKGVVGPGHRHGRGAWGVGYWGMGLGVWASKWARAWGRSSVLGLG